MKVKTSICAYCLALAKQAYVRTVWRLPRVQACTMLGLGFTSYTPHGYFWSSALYGNTLWYHRSQLLPESTFQRSVELVVTVGGTLVLARVLFNGTGAANIMQQWAL